MAWGKGLQEGSGCCAGCRSRTFISLWVSGLKWAVRVVSWSRLKLTGRSRGPRAECSRPPQQTLGDRRSASRPSRGREWVLGRMVRRLPLVPGEPSMCCLPLLLVRPSCGPRGPRHCSTLQGVVHIALGMDPTWLDP